MAELITDHADFREIKPWCAIEAQTSNAGEIGGFKSALEKLPECDHVEIRDQLLRNNVASFTLLVTFKPTALPPSTT